MFGLTGPEGNHGEDVKEYYFYLDNVPSHAYMKYLYKYPQRAFPYADLVEENRRRSRADPEYELLDTGIFDDDRYFDVVVEYAKAAPDDILIRITRHPIAGPRRRRCTCCRRCGSRTTGRGTAHATAKPRIAVARRATPAAVLKTTHRSLPPTGSTANRRTTCCSPRTRRTRQRIFGVPNASPYVKDGIRRLRRARPPRRGESGAGRHQGRGALRPARWPPANRRREAAPARGRRRRARRSAQRIRRDVRAAPAARPTRSTTASRRSRCPTTCATCSGRRSPACCGASSTTATW